MRSVGTAIALDSAGLTNDRSVIGIDATSVTSPVYTDVTLTGVSYLGLLRLGSGLGNTFNHPYASRDALRTVPSDVAANETLTTAPDSGSNRCISMQAVTFVGSSVNGDPTLVKAVALDADGEGFTTTANVLTFPTVEVPAGYTAVYTLLIGGQPSGFTWATATERQDGGSFTSTDQASTMATLNGPHTGAGVTVTLTGIQTRIADRGIFARIWLVPGT